MKIIILLSPLSFPNFYQIITK
uniref:Uncharacterized protein n=1 Tax=Rhizophora mucronata TaxID=61149 RepID=A0A2P2IN06_RHIMU